MKYALALILCLTFIILIVWSHAQIFRVQEITCETSSQESCPEYFFKELNDFYDQSLFTIQPKELGKSSSIAGSGFQIISYHKKLPNKIHLTIRSEKPLFTIENGGQDVLVSEYGRVITSPNQTSVPKVIIEPTAYNGGLDGSSQSIIQNNTLSDPFKSVLTTLVEQFNALDSNIVLKKINWKNSQEIALELQSNIIILTDVETYDQVAEKTKLILQSEAVEDEIPEIREIDLRLDLPVLRTSQ